MNGINDTRRSGVRDGYSLLLGVGVDGAGVSAVKMLQL